MAKIEDKEDRHIHSWASVNGIESYCKNLYYGKPCIKIKVGEAELQRRIEEWNNYYNLAQHSQAKLDYEDMRQAYKEKNFDRMKELRKKIEIRCQIVNNDISENYRFSFNENEYFAKPPDFPDPQDPRLFYEI